MEFSGESITMVSIQTLSSCWVLLFSSSEAGTKDEVNWRATVRLMPFGQSMNKFTHCQLQADVCPQLCHIQLGFIELPCVELVTRRIPNRSIHGQWSPDYSIILWQHN